ncbi:hypothetical protein EHQ53_18255 [Leptospira langatensis]|uniref:Uncharacterized protein n=1 Tax=Leptospira langatensis TaxID=2484983 RepID=A0A5F1ZNV9_9LEPT|nr:hypothetical protein [Leptospira langatensis]TGK05562.1 hypothetical protein EHO57_02495 [Leptospira langatensis]TGL38694.1 hypothetical protein EHQ53_18255 [Leptospira langatensis]
MQEGEDTSLVSLSGGIPLTELLAAAKEAGLDLPKERARPLGRILLAGLLGALRGFSERGLSPFLPTHKHIFQEIVQELTEVYTFLSEEPNEKMVLQEACNFGIKKVYHLEWKLYSSHDLF